MARVGATWDDLVERLSKSLTGTDNQRRPLQCRYFAAEVAVLVFELIAKALAVRQGVSQFFVGEPANRAAVRIHREAHFLERIVHRGREPFHVELVQIGLRGSSDTRSNPTSSSTAGARGEGATRCTRTSLASDCGADDTSGGWCCPGIVVMMPNAMRAGARAVAEYPRKKLRRWGP